MYELGLFLLKLFLGLCAMMGVGTVLDRIARISKEK